MRLTGYFLLMMTLLASCTGSKVISSEGLPYAQLGEPMPAPDAASLGGHRLRDTLFQAGGYEWRAAIVDYGKKGKVYLEDGFWGEGKVNRIRVESPKFRLENAEQVRVGMDWEALQPLGKDWQVVYLADYGLLDAFSETFPHLHFLIRDAQQSPEALAAEEILAGQVSADASVAAIVLM